jgi:hypothetical protein
LHGQAMLRQPSFAAIRPMLAVRFHTITEFIGRKP